MIMQSRGIFLALVLCSIIFGVSGLLPSVYAAEILLDSDTCVDYLFGTWSGSTCTIPSPVEAEIIFDEDLEEEDILTIPGFTTLLIEDGASLIIAGAMVSEHNSEVDNDGTIFMDEESRFVNLGTFVNSGTLTLGVNSELNGDGDITNFLGATITNQDGSFKANGLVSNSGLISNDQGSITIENIFTNNADGDIFNSGTISIFVELDNSGDITNNLLGIIDTAGSSTQSAIFTNNPGSTISNFGILDIDPSGEFFVHSFSDSSTSDIRLGGLFTVNNELTNNGNINIKFSGKIVNLSTFINQGTMTLNSKDTQLAIINSTAGVIFTNTGLGDIQNNCGLIIGPYAGPAPTDNCPFELTIISPSTGDTVTDYTPTTFSGVGQDRDAFGIPVGVLPEISWISNVGDGPIPNGSPVDFLLTTLGPQEITASVIDEHGDTVTASSFITVTFEDKDEDGEIAQTDCDDNDPLRSNDFTEIYGNNIDDDCDGDVDEGFTNDDGDAFPTPEDCNDADATVYPGAPEIVDGILNDCNGTGIPDNEVDDDGDSFIDGIFEVSLEDFQKNSPLVQGDQDCLDVIETDTNAPYFGADPVTVYLDATEILDGFDNDCDGVIPDNEIDADNDGSYADLDCDDNDPARSPNFTEIPDNNIDDDCDGVVDGEVDADGDLYTTDGSDLGNGTEFDCNDADATVYPGAPEIVDGILNDCNGTGIPDNEVDDDLDGFIDGLFPDPPDYKGSQSILGDNDCDDTNAVMWPGNPEILDGFDNDCDTILLDDEIDNDNDGQAEFQGDCDDGDKFIYSGKEEIDDAKDNDCDLEVDEGFDKDGDSFTPIGGGDCLDVIETDPNEHYFGADPLTVYMGALELPDGYDNDCDGSSSDLENKFTTPEFQENLDDKTVRDYEKQAEDLEDEIEDLQKENRKLDKKAEKYETRAEAALEGDTRKAAYYQTKSDRYEEKADEALEDGKERKAAKYEKKSDYFQAKADKALEGDAEKAAKYQDKADKLRDKIASNESLIEMYGKQILVIDMSLGNTPVDWTQTIVVEYPLLTEDAKHDILHDIEDNLKDMSKLEEKAVKYDEKATKEEGKGNEDKAEKYRLKAIEAREEIEIIEDLNTVLECAIDFTPDMLADHGHHGHHSNDKDDDHDDKGNKSDKYSGYGDDD